MTSDQKSQLATPTYKTRKEKMAGPHLVGPGSVQILGEVDPSFSDGQKVATDKRKVTPEKESTKKSSKSSSSSSFDEIKALETKWLERFSRLEAILLAFQPTTGQVSCQHISMPVSLKRQLPVDVLASDTPFIQHARPVSQT